MISTLNVKCNAAKPNFPLQPMFAFMGSPSSLRILDVPKSIGNWAITSVKVVVTYPDNIMVEKNAVRNGSVWVATVEGCNVAGKVANGYEVLADGKDEDGSDVTGYVLGKGDVYIIENGTDISRLLDKIAVRYIEDIPDVPTKGDLMNSNGQLRLFDGNDWILISTGEHSVVYDSQITIQKNGTPVGSFTVNASEPTAVDIPVPSRTSDIENDVGYITANALPTKVSELQNDVGFITASAIPSNVGAFTNDVGYLTASDVSTSALYPSSPYSAYVQIDDYGEVNAKKLLNETGVWFVKAIIEQYTPNPVTGYWVSNPKITDNGTNLLVEFWVQDKARKYEPQKITYDASSSAAIEMLITVDFNGVVFRVQLKKSTQADIPTWIDCGRLVRDGDANTGLRISQLEDDIGLVHDISGKRDLTDLSYSGKDEDAFFLGVGSFTIELPDTWTATEQKTWVLDIRQKNENYYKLWGSSPTMFFINTLNDAAFNIMDINSTQLGSFTWNQVKGGDKVAVTITYQGVEYPCHVQANWEATTLATANDVVKMSKNNTLLTGENIRINTNGQSNIGLLVANQYYNGYALTQSGIAKYDSNAATKAFNFPSEDATGSTFATREWVQSQGYSSGGSVDDYVPVTIQQNFGNDSTSYHLQIYNHQLGSFMEYYTNTNQMGSGYGIMNFMVFKVGGWTLGDCIDHNGVLGSSNWYVEYSDINGNFYRDYWDNVKDNNFDNFLYVKVVNG